MYLSQATFLKKNVTSQIENFKRGNTLNTYMRWSKSFLII